MDKHFQSEKARILGKVDLSRKGSVDEPIRELIEFINRQESFYTTSSCSGRLVVFSEDCKQRKKQCNWLLVSHDEISLSQLVSSLSETDCSDEQESRSLPENYTLFKFEPFILHCMCRCLKDAQTLLQLAVGCGFRNSGISFGKKGKIMVAVRSTHSLEVPVAYQGKRIVSEEYLQHLLTLGNGKLRENKQRIDSFYSSLQCLSEHKASVPTNPVPPPTNPSPPQKKTRGAKHPHSPLTQHQSDCSDIDFEIEHLFS